VGAVLIVDSVFAFRPEYNDLWDYRIWLGVPADLSLRRGSRALADVVIDNTDFAHPRLADRDGQPPA
jgi:hypothetical protein